MRISVLTQNQNRYGLKLLNLLQWNEIPVEQVVVFTDLWRLRLRWFRRATRRIGWVGAATYVAAWKLRSPFARQGFIWRGRHLERDYHRLARRVEYVPAPRSTATAQALQSAEPDLCLLAQSGIVPASVLVIPRLAALNAHPGILPEYRGVDTELWAIYEDRFDYVGCTLHAVDEGIDTGPVLEVRPYHWVGDETLDRLDWRLNETSLDLLAGACREQWPAYLKKAIPQGDGRLYYLLPPRLRPEVERKLELFRSTRAPR